MSINRQLTKLAKAQGQKVVGWAVFPVAYGFLMHGAYKTTLALAAGNIAYCLWRVPTSCGAKKTRGTSLCTRNAKGLLQACGNAAHKQQWIDAFVRARDWQVVQQRLRQNWLPTVMLAGSLLLIPITGLVALVRLAAG